VLIAEQLMMVLLDPERGELDVRRDATDPDHLATAALLLDLAEQRSIDHRDGRIAFRMRMPLRHPLLDIAGEALATAGPGLPIGSALDLIETRTRPVSRTLLDGLHRRDLLHRLRRPAWWPFARWRSPLRSLQARNEALTVMRGGVRRSRLREEGLLLLADSAGRLPHFLDAATHARATATLLALGAPQEHRDADAALLATLRATLLTDD
jgi:hypothetical protein